MKCVYKVTIYTPDDQWYGCAGPDPTEDGYRDSILADFNKNGTRCTVETISKVIHPYWKSKMGKQKGVKFAVEPSE